MQDLQTHHTTCWLPDRALLCRDVRFCLVVGARVVTWTSSVAWVDAFAPGVGRVGVLPRDPALPEVGPSLLLAVTGALRILIRGPLSSNGCPVHLSMIVAARDRGSSAL
jgi:hypothetical protein